jgi:arylamine N-acetyltransferase
MPEELLEDYVKLGAGGTCFSLVYTLHSLLKDLKFDSHIMLADRTYGENTHASVIVYIAQQKILLDPGYLVPTPVVLPSEGQQISHSMPMSSLVIETVLGNFKVSTQRNQNLTFRYLIKGSPVPEKEFVKIWESSFEHKMMDNLFMTKLTPTSQIYVRENRVEIITKEDRKKYYLSDNFTNEVSKIFGISQRVLEELKKCHSLKL